MKKSILLSITLSFLALTTVVTITHSFSSKNKLLMENVEALADHKIWVGCIDGQTWGEGTPMVHCSGCSVVWADAWRETAYCQM